MHLILRVSHVSESPQVLVFQASCGDQAHRSISPMTMSIDPTMAGTSAMRQPRQMALVTERLRKLDDFARTRSGTACLDGAPTTWKPIAPRGHSVSTYASPPGRCLGGSMRCDPCALG